MFEFMNLPYDDNGNLFPGLAENQVKGQLGAIRTILESLGYDAATIEGAGEISDGWFLHDQNHGRHGYVEFVPGQKGVHCCTGTPRGQQWRRSSVNWSYSAACPELGSGSRQLNDARPPLLDSTSSDGGLFFYA